jgi:hypothetical protein
MDLNNWGLGIGDWDWDCGLEIVFKKLNVGKLIISEKNKQTKFVVWCFFFKIHHKI